MTRALDALAEVVPVDVGREVLSSGRRLGSSEREGMPGLVSVLLVGGSLGSGWEHDLGLHGFAVVRVDEAAALRLVHCSLQELVVVRRGLLQLPALVGFGRELRRLDPALGIVMLASHWEPPERRALLASCADVCLVDGVDAEELSACLTALRRRAQRPVTFSVMKWGPFRLDFIGGCVEIDGREVPLQPLQLRVLGCLMQHAGSVVPHATLRRLVFRHQRFASTSIARQVCVLRQHLGALGRAIHTTPQGYGLGVNREDG